MRTRSRLMPSRAIEPADDQAVRSLRDRARRLAEAEELSGTGSWEWPTGDPVPACSDQLLRCFGVSPGAPWPSRGQLLDRIHPSDRALVEAAGARLRSEGEPYDLDVRVLEIDDGARWVNLRGAPVRDERGRLVRVHGVVQDITGRHATLAGGQPWAGRIDTLLRQAHDVAAMLDDEGRILYATPSFARRLGHAVGTQDGAPITDLVHPADRALVAASLAELQGGGTSIGPVRVRLLRPDGSSRAYEAVAIAITDGSGSWIAINAHELDEPAADDPQAEIAPDALVTDLASAIEAGQLHVVYQPQVSFESGEIIGVEALLRWDRPGVGLVPPTTFIPVAEEHGLIEELGRWVLTEACRQLVEWNHEHGGRLQMAVNVSPRQFGPSLVGVVEAVLEATGAPADQVCLELTEGTVMADVTAAAATLRSLNALGVLVSIDDFGTGYSSLAHLRRFDLDELKVDKSFVDGLGASAEDTAVVAAIVALAHALGLSVVAEGVETTAQLDELRRLGCQAAQGYLFARPQPPADIASLLAAGCVPALRRAAAPDGEARTVLVVDDAEDVLMLASVSLATAGFTVVTARDGAGAVAATREHRPAAILLDVGLPDMTGIEVCAALRAEPAGASATIIMLTAQGDAHHKATAFTMGADDYIVKPFSPRDLVGRLHASLRQRDEGARPT